MRWLGILGGIALVLYLLTGVTFVRPGERAVVRRFGKVVDKPGPGLYVGLPWGLDRVDRVPVDLVRQVTVGYQENPDGFEPGFPVGQLLTGDHNLVNVRVDIYYAVRDDEVENYVVQAGQVDDLVSRTVEAALADWVAGHSVDEVLRHGTSQLPQWLVVEAQQRLESYGLGVQLTAADVGCLEPPAEVKSDFDQVTRTEAGIVTRINQAQQEAEARIRRAESERYRIEQLTAAYVNERLRLAQAEAYTFTARLQQYRRLKEKNPDFLAGLWWQEMGKLFQDMKANGRIDLLDNYLNSDGLDITQVAPQPKK